MIYDDLVRELKITLKSIESDINVAFNRIIELEREIKFLRRRIVK